MQFDFIRSKTLLCSIFGNVSTLHMKVQFGFPCLSKGRFPSVSLRYFTCGSPECVWSPPCPHTGCCPSDEEVSAHEARLEREPVQRAAACPLCCTGNGFVQCEATGYRLSFPQADTKTLRQCRILLQVKGSSIIINIQGSGTFTLEFSCFKDFFVFQKE